PQPWPASPAGPVAVTVPAGAGHRTEVHMKSSTKAANPKSSRPNKPPGRSGGKTVERQKAQKPTRPRGNRTRTRPEPSLAAAAPRSSKQAAVITLLKRPEGVTIAEVMAATGWQPHTVRGLFSGTLKKKLGLRLSSAAADRGRVYRIIDAGRTGDNARAHR